MYLDKKACISELSPLAHFVKGDNNILNFFGGKDKVKFYIENWL